MSDSAKSIAQIQLIIEAKSNQLRALTEEEATKSILLTLSKIAQQTNVNQGLDAGLAKDMARFVYTYFGGLSPREIMLAYHLLASGQLKASGDATMWYGRMTINSVGSTLNAYCEWKKDVEVALHTLAYEEKLAKERYLREQKSKEQYEAMKVNIIPIIKAEAVKFADTGRHASPLIYPLWYDILIEKNLLTVALVVKTKYFEQAKQKAEAELSEEISQLRTAGRTIEANNRQASMQEKIKPRAGAIAKGDIIAFVIETAAKMPEILNTTIQLND